MVSNTLWFKFLIFFFKQLRVEISRNGKFSKRLHFKDNFVISFLNSKKFKIVYKLRDFFIFKFYLKK